MSAHDSVHNTLATALRAPTRPVAGGDFAQGGDDAQRRLAVHRNTFIVSLVDALADAFPVSQALVGEPFFRAMARERVLADPPRSPVLIDYALGMPDFIAAFAPAASVPYLADVAQIEARRIQAHHAADAAPLPHAAYHALLADPSRLHRTRVVLHPACTWFRSQHAACTLWQAHQGLAHPSAAALEDVDATRAEDTLVARPGLEVAVQCLPPGALELLDALRDDLTLGRAFQRARLAVPLLDDGALFAVLVTHGLVVALDPLPEP